jgi:hypothetical protein
VCNEFQKKKEQFTTEYRREFGPRGNIRYPEDLASAPVFSDWLREVVAIASNSRNRPSVDVIEASKLPEIRATAYRAMYVNGMHLRIRTAEEEKVTCDSAIASAVWKRSRSVGADDGGTLDKMEYVGWVEEILELNYRSHCVIVLLCSWVSAKLDDPNSKVLRDRYGFSLANLHSANSEPGPNTFAFPTQCRQVFFSNDQNYSRVHGGDWKVVCSTDVRGRRGDWHSARPDIEILYAGRDSDFEGLHLRIP